MVGTDRDDDDDDDDDGTDIDIGVKDDTSVANDDTRRSVNGPVTVNFMMNKY